MDDEDDFAHCECAHCSGPSGPCAVCELEAELRWCDAERRLALRALAEYAPVCIVCMESSPEYEWQCARLERYDRLYCATHAPPRTTPLPYAAQIAAADEEIER